MKRRISGLDKDAERLYPIIIAPQLITFAAIGLGYLAYKSWNAPLDNLHNTKLAGTSSTQNAKEYNVFEDKEIMLNESPERFAQRFKTKKLACEALSKRSNFIPNKMNELNQFINTHSHVENVVSGLKREMGFDGIFEPGGNYSEKILRILVENDLEIDIDKLDLDLTRSNNELVNKIDSKSVGYTRQLSRPALKKGIFSFLKKMFFLLIFQ